MNEIKTVSVVGLGKLGLPFSVCMAEQGFEVIAVDINKENIESLQNKKSPIEETDLQDYIERNHERMTFTESHKEAIEKSDVTFIVVATPSDENGNFSNKYVESALESLSKELKESQKENHIFVINSTVMPTSTEKRLLPLIEENSGRKIGEGVEVCYAPDFVALGNVIKDFLNPDMVVIGQTSEKAGDTVSSVYKQMCQNDPEIHRMSIISAEIAKVSLNMYITTKISFANMLANICSRVEGADVDSITNALGNDKRISPYYFKGGLSFGGTCFPRDTKAFSAFAKKVEYSDNLVSAVNEINESQDQYLENLVGNFISKSQDNKVSILGLSFKPGTPEIEKSPSITLIKNLLEKDFEITVYDPLALERTREIFGDKINYTESPEECLKNSQVWVLANGDKLYKDIDFNNIRDDEIYLIDCWRSIDKETLRNNIVYTPFGKKYDF